MNSLEIAQIILKITGPIRPTGEHQTDTDRLKNVKLLGDVISDLTGELACVAKMKTSHEFSVSELGKKAQAALDMIKEDFL